LVPTHFQVELLPVFCSPQPQPDKYSLPGENPVPMNLPEATIAWQIPRN
jgi:hypothetical protein